MLVARLPSPDPPDRRRDRGRPHLSGHVAGRGLRRPDAGAAASARTGTTAAAREDSRAAGRIAAAAERTAARWGTPAAVARCAAAAAGIRVAGRPGCDGYTVVRSVMGCGRRLRRPPDRTGGVTDLEAQQRPVRVADVDRQAVVDVDGGQPAAVDEKPVQRAVVDGDPAVVVEPQQHVGPRYQWMCDAHVGPEIATDHNVMACGEGALRPVVPNGQRRCDWSTHRRQL